MRLPRFLNRGMDVVDDRTGLITATKGAMYHRVPRNAKWWYVFGSATLMFFIIQLLHFLIAQMEVINVGVLLEILQGGGLSA